MYLRRLSVVAGLAMTLWCTSIAALQAEDHSEDAMSEKRQPMTLELRVTGTKSRYRHYRRSEFDLPVRVTRMLGYKFGKFVGDCVCEKVKQVRICRNSLGATRLELQVPALVDEIQG